MEVSSGKPGGLPHNSQKALNFKSKGDAVVNKIEKIQPQDLPTPASAHSPAVSVPLPGADMIFVTGQVAVDADDNIVAPNDAKTQAIFVFENIQKILAEAGASLDDVVKVQMFVTNIDDFAVVSSVRNQYLDKARPASTLFEVSALVEEGCVVEIEAIAVKLKN